MYWKRTLRIVHFIQMCILQFFFSIMQGLIPFWIIFNFLLSLTHSDKCQFFMHKSSFYASYQKLFFQEFFENSSIIFLSRKQHGFMSTEQLGILSNIRHTSDPNVIPLVILFELMIFPFIFFVVWVTFPHVHPIT